MPSTEDFGKKSIYMYKYLGVVYPTIEELSQKMEVPYHTALKFARRGKDSEGNIVRRQLAIVDRGRRENGGLK